MSQTFVGVPDPQANYTKVPNIILENLDQFSSKAELAVVLYITRHTWGFHEPDGKRISQDEFEHGRKRRRGMGRMDGGTGLSRNALKDGLRRAEADGFIIVEEEGDRGRLERYYSLRYENEPKTDILNPTVDAPAPVGEGQKLTMGGSEVDHGEGQKLITVHRKKLERNISKKATVVAPAYEAGQYYGLEVRMTEEGEETFECPNPECAERQPWPARSNRTRFHCTACETPLAGFLPNSTNDPYYKPPRRPVQKKQLDTLVPGCPTHLATIPYFEVDKLRLQAALRTDHQKMWKLIDWAYRQQMAQHVIVKNALTAFYKPEHVIKTEARKVKAIHGKPDPVPVDGRSTVEMHTAVDF